MTKWTMNCLTKINLIFPLKGLHGSFKHAKSLIDLNGKHNDKWGDNFVFWKINL